MSFSSFSGTGTVFIGLCNTSGVLTDDMQQVGDAHPLQIQVSTETKKHISRMVATAGQTLATKTTISETIGSMTLRQWNKDNLKYALAGSATAQTGTAGSVTDEVWVANSDRYKDLAQNQVSVHKVIHGTVTAGPFLVGDTLTGGSSGTTSTVVWVGSLYLLVHTVAVAAYTVGETVTGTGGASAAVVSAADIVDINLTDTAGTTKYTLDTDYNLNAYTGKVQVLSTGSIVDAASLKADYQYAAETGYAVTIAENAQIRVRLEAELENEYDSTQKFHLILYSVVLSPNTEINFISDADSDYEELPFSLSLETPTGYTTPGTINGIPL